MSTVDKKIDNSIELIKDIVGKAKIGIILASGLEDLSKQVENIDIINCYEYEVLSASPSKGSVGIFVTGTLQGKKIIFTQAPTEEYEKCNMEEIDFYVKMLKEVGVEYLIVTSNSKCLNKNCDSGDLMIIKSHIDTSGKNLVVNNTSHEQQIIDMTKAVAEEIDIDIKECIFGDIRSPDDEAIYKLRFNDTSKCDVIGIHNAPKILAVKTSGISVLEITCAVDIKNLEKYQNSKEKFVLLIKEIISIL